ncbi:sensor histidine kinase [Ascidiimonas sp. W6]|uniref:sensor histidine kinase n=1 Tax=Ascidiimonas meishanensis TaxID=3128903 RepID=UPI0030EDE06E
MEQKEIQFLVLAVSIVLIILVVTLILIFSVFQKRKTQLLIKQAEERRHFEMELAKSQNEIQEQTFKNISWELHDNIGQLLSVAKMQLNMLQADVSEIHAKRLNEASEVLGKGLSEMRQLSRSLNTDFISNLGLVDSFEAEINRFKRMNFFKINYNIEGEPIVIDQKDEIIIFRIFQECFSNCVKYSKATELNILLKFSATELYISSCDNGIGFDPNTQKTGSGLMNMRKRSELIKANLDLKTNVNKGVCVTLKYPIKQITTS